MSSPLPAPLSYPPADPSPYGPSNNDNANLPAAARPGADFRPGSSLSVPGGTYFFHEVAVNGSTVLTFTAPAVVYAYGTVTITGSVSTSDNLPKNLRIITVRDPSTGAAPGPISLGSNAALYTPTSTRRSAP